MIVLIWILFGIASAIAAANKGRSVVVWFFLGCLLGPFGLIFALLISRRSAPAPATAAAASPPLPFLTPAGDISLAHETKQCPACAESIKLEALKCRFCFHTFDPDQVAATTNARRLELQERALLIAGGRFCPHCLQGDVRIAHLGDGSYGPWCPHCQKPVDLV